jgi:benzoyl-CoA-dihydrodiol lyase
MDVQEDAGCRPNDYKLKLNSYDLGVDIELADALQRLRFEHPEVHTSSSRASSRASSAPAPTSSCWAARARLQGELLQVHQRDAPRHRGHASAHSGIKFLAALNGICAGGGYELALACDEICLVDDGNAAVSLPETPLLGVLPGTGGLTRVVDKRKVRRDLADVFSTLAEGVRGKRAVEWRFVDAVVSRRASSRSASRARAGAGGESDRPPGPRHHARGRSNPKVDDDTHRYKYVSSRSTAPSAPRR